MQSKGFGMRISADAVHFDDHTMWMDLKGGRTIGATGHGPHWNELDEDISVAGLLKGRGDNARRRSTAA